VRPPASPNKSAGVLGAGVGTVEQAQPPPSTEKTSGGVTPGTVGPASGIGWDGGAAPHLFVVVLQIGAAGVQVELSVH
jgi:hypothetical protein